jgi:hypothetical protein
MSGGGSWSPGGTWWSRSCLVPGDRSRGHWARGGPRATTCPSGRSWSHEARGDPGAILCQETGAGATWHVVVPELLRVLVAGARATRYVAAPELSCARRREPWDTWAYAPVLSFVLTWSLYVGVSDLQGTDSGPQAHPGRGCELTGGINILSRVAFPSFICWDFEAVVQHGRYVVAHDPRGTLQCSERLAEPSHTAVPLGLLLCSGSHGAQGNHDHNSEPSGCHAVEVAGVQAIVTMIFEPTGLRTYGKCRMFYFCAAVPLLLSLVLTDVRDLGPHVSA